MSHAADNDDERTWAQLIPDLRASVDRVLSAAQDLTTAGARMTPSPLAAPLARYLELVAALSDMLTGPMQSLLDDQERLAEQMAVWSARNAELSDQLALWAEQHRQVTSHMRGLVRPAVAQVARATDATRGLAQELRSDQP